MQAAITTPSYSFLQKIVGTDAPVLSQSVLLVNKLVTASFIKLEAGTDEKPLEQGGRLLLYPFADGQFSMHLVYEIPTTSDTLYRELCWLQFEPAFFDMFDEEALLHNTPFRFDQTTEHNFAPCAQTNNLVQQLREIGALTPLLQSMQLSEVALQILRRAIEHVTLPFTVCPVPACRFLAHESEREKIFAAKSIMEETIDQPLTIKELSRKVAMNECYLKKGFKTIMGKTINEYQQSLRITKAKELLQLQGQTVSDVASLLGYSSISHFSTAFKKATGLKPCELLG